MDIEKALLGISGGKNPFAYSDLGVFFSKAIELMMVFAGIASFIYLVWGGLEWITSGGDKAGTEKAKSKITDSVIGLVIVFTSWAIFQIIQTFLGFQVTETPTTLTTPASKCPNGWTFKETTKQCCISENTCYTPTVQQKTAPQPNNTKNKVL